MADKTGIEWTDATWNPIVGCSIVSKGCTNCYAMKAAHRMEHILDATKNTAGNIPPHHYRSLTKESKSGPVWTGRVNTAPKTILTQPLRWKHPRRIFVNSMSDLFHENVLDRWIDMVFAVMALTPQHTYQILTKRPERMRSYINGVAFYQPCRINKIVERLVGANKIDSWSPPFANVWLGVSVEDQETAETRIPVLLDTPAAVRFISCEPLLGKIDLNHLDIHEDGCISALTALDWQKYYDTCWKGTEQTGEETLDRFLDYHNLSAMPSGKMHNTLDWVIVGGESGKDARPMHPDWARQLRDQCAGAAVPFFFKQWGEWAPGENCPPQRRTEKTASWWNNEWSFDSVTPAAAREQHIEDEPDLYRIGKRNASNMLDGICHNAYPIKTEKEKQ